MLLDMRLESSKATVQRRSVNLAISSRGLAALEFVDSALAARFLETAIPMKGRIIHDDEGTRMQIYDPLGGVSASLFTQFQSRLRHSSLNSRNA